MAPMVATKKRAGERAEPVAPADGALPPEAEPVSLLDDGEEIVQPVVKQDGLDSLEVEAKVVYLGGNRYKSVYFPGSVTQSEDEEGRAVYQPVFSFDSGTTYNFERFDSKGRLNRSRLTKDNRIYHVCRHIGHLASFLKEVDEDGSPVFEVRADSVVRRRIERYLRLRAAQEAKNVDRGQPVLAAMGLA